MLNEADLIAAAQRGEVSAFEALVLRYQDLVLRVAYLITGDVPTAEDVAQEGFMKAYRALPHFRRGAPLRPWLLRIIANEAKNHQRATARRERLILQVAASGTGGADSATPEESALASEQRQTLLAALERLRDEDRLMIAGRYFLSLSEAEMASLLGCPRGTVKSRLARALDRLRHGLESDPTLAASTPGRYKRHG
ncbi:MAG TPA: sigma-70 family RNA polymerase sigma factor [Chloroflexota bacterium]|nr:sigma-70 family RNA polymerase sigma factor [Chloroflexota bacterium]